MIGEMAAGVAGTSSPGRFPEPWAPSGSRVLRALRAGRDGARSIEADTGRPKPGGEDGFDPIDIGEFENRLRGHRDVIRRSLRLFRDECRTGSEGLWRCVAARDWSGAAAVAHRLKGAAGMVSAADLRRAASEMEAACRTEQAEAATLRLVEVEREVSRVMNQLGRVIDRSG